MKTDYKKLLPHLYVVLFFIAICAVYFNPVLQGKGLSQHDTEQWEGMAKEIADHRDKFGEEPLWTRSMFGGMPAYQISVLYPNNLVSYVNKVLLLGFPEPYGYVLLSLLGFYLLLLCFKLDWRMAATGAIAYAFSSYNFIILMAGHNSKLHAIALMPFVVAGVVMVFNGRYLFGGAVTSMGLALQIYANHLLFGHRVGHIRGSAVFQAFEGRFARFIYESGHHTCNSCRVSHLTQHYQSLGHNGIWQGYHTRSIRVNR
jgi:hypothetical protein